MNAIIAPKERVHKARCSRAAKLNKPIRLATGERSGALAKRALVLTGLLLATVSHAHAQAQPGISLAPTTSAFAQPKDLTSPSGKIWQGNVGDGFLSSAQSLSIETSVALGVQAFGGQQVHDLSLLSISYGHMLGSVVGQDHWYRGNWEARAELFSGAQFSPDAVPLVGLTPHIRYNFATGTRWVPFADLGAGVTASGIGAPDQSGTFEFNLQANIGTHWFLRDDLALTFEAGYLHFSCAGLHDPNLGVNTVKGAIGLTWFF
jgi:hypothetical protein